MGTEHYIEELLYRYQCVIMPGFGAFLTQTKPAVLQKNSSTFLPPSKVLSFNEQLSLNDGLLAAHIAGAEKISFESALQKLEAESEVWKARLRDGSKVVLQHIGVLRLTTENKVQFEPASPNNFLTSSFGFSSILANPIKRESYKETVEALEEQIPFKITPEVRETHTGIRPYLKYAAIILLALSTGITGFKLYEQQIDRMQVVQQEVQEQLERNIQEATFFSSKPVELPSITLKVTPAKRGKHHIIAGAFRFRANADKKIEQLKELGYDAFYLGTNAYGLHQVSYGSFDDPQEALTNLKNIRRNLSGDAWLLSEK